MLLNVNWNAYDSNSGVVSVNTPSDPFLGCSRKPIQNQASTE